jgi:hypothetical protein
MVPTPWHDHRHHFLAAGWLVTGFAPNPSAEAIGLSEMNSGAVLPPGNAQSDYRALGLLKPTTVAPTFGGHTAEVACRQTDVSIWTQGSHPVQESPATRTALAYLLKLFDCSTSVA